MLNPIDFYDISDIIIQREMNLTQSNSNLTNSSIISINNTGNMAVYPVINLTTYKTISTIVISNITNGNTISLVGNSVFASGAVFDIFYDATYSAGTEITNANYRGIFILAENAVNSIKFTISPTVSTAVNVVTQWLQPSSVQTVQAYVENFSITENRTTKQPNINILNKYNGPNSYVTQTVTYDFNFDKLWFDSWFHNESEDETYRIKWATSSDLTSINQQTYYLNGCKFNNLTWNQSQNDMVRENIKGVACRKLSG